jgi:hypothetical protein
MSFSSSCCSKPATEGAAPTSLFLFWPFYILRRDFSHLDRQAKAVPIAAVEAVFFASSTKQLFPFAEKKL